jgi:two-component system, NtrC family, response regulator HydG
MNTPIHILIVDDDKRMTQTLTDILTVAGHETESANSAPEALEKVKSKAFDCILTDVRMPEMDGVAFHKVLRKEQPGIPVVLMTAYAADEMIQRGLEEGIIGVLSKPLNISQLLGFFSALAKHRTIAIVDDDPNFCKTLSDILNTHGFTTTLETNPHADMNLLATDAQVVLLDMKLNSISGLDIFKHIKHDFPDLPIVLVTAFRKEMEDSVRIALDNSAFTCLYKPLEIEELLKLLEKLQRERLRSVISTSQGSTLYR